jgi:hypothetical protein
VLSQARPDALARPRIPGIHRAQILDEARIWQGRFGRVRGALCKLVQVLCVRFWPEWFIALRHG